MQFQPPHSITPAAQVAVTRGQHALWSAGTTHLTHSKLFCNARELSEIAAYFRGQQEGMPLTSAPPGSFMVSWGEGNTYSGCGHSGRTLPGATPQMKVRFRDWLTPKLPAFSTPKRTCTHSPHPGDQLAAWRSLAFPQPPETFGRFSFALHSMPAADGQPEGGGGAPGSPCPAGSAG